MPSFERSEIEAALERQSGEVAAVIIEPVIGAAGGAIAPPIGYLRRVADACQAHDVLLIADEVVTGFGRLGSMFGSEHYGIEADIITSAKGLTSAYAPLSASIVSERVWKVLEQGTDEFGAIGHGWTYSAHPIGAAAGVANLKLVDELGLVKNAAETGDYFKQAMTAALGDHPNVGDVRGEGLLLAVELVAERESRTYFDPSLTVGAKVAAALVKRGVIARAMPQGDILGFAPPLCIAPAEADIIVGAMEEAVKETCPS